MAYAYLIANPSAGASKTKGKIPKIIDILKAKGLDFESSITEAPGHAIELAELAVKKGCKIIISVGGDGTVNEVVNGIYNAGGLEDVLLGVISTGTGADYIRTLGIPRSYENSCSLITNPQFRLVDVGVVEWDTKKRLFVNFAGVGFDVEIVKATTENYKAMGRVSAYLLGLFATLISYSNKKMLVTIDNIEKEMKICTILMGNGKYGGGGMLTTPLADVADGLLDVLIVGDLSKLDLIRSLPRIYSGTHLTHPKVSLEKAKTIFVKPETMMSVQVDGDIVATTPATFKLLPLALKVIV